MGNSNKYITHFILQCTAIIYGPPAIKDALLLQLFVQSLEGEGFTCYRSPLKNPILSWQRMEHEFSGQFCNTQRWVSIPE